MKKFLGYLFIYLGVAIMSFASGAGVYFWTTKYNIKILKFIKISSAERSTPKQFPSWAPTIINETKNDDGTKTFRSEYANFQFSYPDSVTYFEEDPRADNIFLDDIRGFLSKFEPTKNDYPSFEAVSSDFFSPDSKIQNCIVSGELDSATSFDAVFSMKEETKVKYLEPNVYLVTGYDVDRSFPVYLYVKPPEGSGLKCINFFIENNIGLVTTSDFVDNNPGKGLKLDSIRRLINYGLENSDVKTADKIKKAIDITRTFRTKF